MINRPGQGPHRYGRSRLGDWVRRVRVRPPTWSDIEINGSVVLTNAKLTATSPNIATSCTVRGDTATTIIGAGDKRFWGTRIDVANGPNEVGVGFCNASQTFGADHYIGGSPNSYGFYNGTGDVFFNAVNVFDLAVFAAGDIVWQAYDFAIKRWWAAVNNGGWLNDVIGNQNPATGTGGIDVSAFGDVFPAASIRLLGGVTLIPGPSFLRAAPAGFTGFA